VEEVAEAHRQGIGGVLAADLQAQKLLHHELHLGLAGLAVAHHRLFHHQGRIDLHRHPHLGGGQEDHSPDLSQGEGAFDVAGQKEVLQGQGVGAVALQDLQQGVINLTQALRQGGPAPRGNLAVGHMGHLLAPAGYHAKAGGLGAGVHPHHHLGRHIRASMILSGMSKLAKTLLTSSWSSSISTSLRTFWARSSSVMDTVVLGRS